MRTHHALIAVLSFITILGLFVYPVMFITFPWTVPVPYLLALMASIGTFLVAITTQDRA